MGWLWIVALFTVFVAPAIAIARLHAPSREQDPNNTSDAATLADELRRHQFR